MLSRHESLLGLSELLEIDTGVVQQRCGSCTTVAVGGNLA